MTVGKVAIKTEGKMTKAELNMEYAKCLKIVTSGYSRMDDLKARKKELSKIIGTKIKKETEELREIAMQAKELDGELREVIGAYKLLTGFLKKVGATPEKNVDKLIEASVPV